jgi:hypothetical protein
LEGIQSAEKWQGEEKVQKRTSSKQAVGVGGRGSNLKSSKAAMAVLCQQLVAIIAAVTFIQ